MQLALASVGAALWLRRRKAADNGRFLSRFAAGLSCYIVIYRIMLFCTPGYDFQIWNELPLHLCNILSFLFIPAAVMGDSPMERCIKALCFFGGMVAPPMAMAMPIPGFTDVSVFSSYSLGFYGFHGLLMVLAVCFCTLGVYRPRYGDIPGALAALLVLCLGAHGVNLLLRATVYSGANYFYTYGIPGNIIMDALQALIPLEFVWMLPLLAPVGAVWALITFAVRRCTQSTGRPAGSDCS